MMLATPEPPAPPGEAISLLLAADLQDHLLTASNDLDRLQTLLSDACDVLSASFFGANAQVDGLRAAAHESAAAQVAQHLSSAITALQFQDMASQLIAHTHKRLRNCADRLAADAFAGDEDEGEGAAVIEQAPLRPNPVTQDEMDAGSIDLF
jgi:hypothetical protein